MGERLGPLGCGCLKQTGSETLNEEKWEDENALSLSFPGKNYRPRLGAGGEGAEKNLSRAAKTESLSSGLEANIAYIL